MGKFEQTFDEPVSFSDGTYVISGYLSREEAAKEFSEYFGEEVKPENVRPERVRFGFAPENIEDRGGEACWYTGAGNSKGTKPVWVTP